MGWELGGAGRGVQPGPVHAPKELLGMRATCGQRSRAFYLLSDASSFTPSRKTQAQAKNLLDRGPQLRKGFLVRVAVVNTSLRDVLYTAHTSPGTPGVPRAFHRDWSRPCVGLEGWGGGRGQTGSLRARGVVFTARGGGEARARKAGTAGLGGTTGGWQGWRRRRVDSGHLSCSVAQGGLQVGEGQQLSPCEASVSPGCLQSGREKRFS